MSSIIDLFSTKEVVIVLIILGIILFTYFILWFVEYIKKHEEKKKLQNNTMELNKLVLEEAIRKQQEEDSSINTMIDEVEEVKLEEESITLEPEKIEEDVKVVEEVVIENGFATPLEVEPLLVSDSNHEKLVSNDTILLNDKIEEVEVVEAEINNSEDVIKYKDEVYTQTEAQQELERLTEELRKLEEENNENKVDSITKYESEQEENAIISLDELLSKGKEMTLENEVTQYMDDGNEPISISELEARYKESINTMETIEELEVIDNEPVVLEEVKIDNNKELNIDYFLNNNSVNDNAYSNTNKYKASPVISPIFGIEEENLSKSTALELENTADYEKLDEEIKKTNEFLAKLRELQEKLD